MYPLHHTWLGPASYRQLTVCTLEKELNKKRRLRFLHPGENLTGDSILSVSRWIPWTKIISCWLFVPTDPEIGRANGRCCKCSRSERRKMFWRKVWVAKRDVGKLENRDDSRWVGYWVLLSEGKTKKNLVLELLFHSSPLPLWGTVKFSSGRSVHVIFKLIGPFSETNSINVMFSVN